MLSDFFTKKSAKWTIIAGLGNPGREYAHTRHNVGFDTLDILSDRYDIPIDMARFNAHLGKGEIEGRKVILLKPQTYMNLSGESVSGAVNYYKADPETDLIVIYDDIYLGIGDIRIRKQGSAGGHNGMKNIIRQLGSENYLRIRIGVGEKPREYDLADYVLSHFSAEERERLDAGLIDAANAAVLILKEGADAAMNRYNKKHREKPSEDEG